MTNETVGKSEQKNKNAIIYRRIAAVLLAVSIGYISLVLMEYAIYKGLF